MTNTFLLAKKTTTKRQKFKIFKLLCIFCLVFGFGVSGVWGQTYYDMSSGNYSQNFNGITALPTNFSAVAVLNTGSIPIATKTTTASTNSLSVVSSSAAVGIDVATSTSLVFLTTGSTDNSTSIATDLNLNFTSRNAGTLGYTASTIFNSTGNRVSSLRVYYSLDGTTWTELTGTNLPYVATNNVAGNGSVSISLPSALNNQATVKLRFYYHNGSGGTTGSRPKIGIDGLTISSTASSAAPTLTTPTVTFITDISANLGATITADGGSSITARGTSFKTSSPVIATDNQLAEGGTTVAAYTHSRTSLTPQTQYFYAGYATNSTGTGLSTEGNFRTLSTTPTVQSSGVTATAASSSQIDLSVSAATFPGSGATQGGYVVIYATGTPTLSSSNGTAPAAGVGTIFTTSATNLPTTPSTTLNVTGLSTATAYNFLVVPYTWDGTNASTYNYLTTSAPTANATTNSGPPTLTTPTVASITNNSATIGATVTSNGGSALLARGTVYKTSATVAITDNPLAEGGTSVSAFTHSRTSLSPETQYFYAGYATNASTSALSSESSFRTISNPPTVQAGLSASAVSTTQINLTISAATFPASGATQAGYVVIYSTGTPTLSSTNGAAPAAGVGSIFATTATVLPSTPSTTLNVTGLTQSTLYNFLVVPYTWDGTNTNTYNYLTASAPTANATTQGPVNIAIQDFEAIPATPTWIYSGTGATDNTTSRFNGLQSYKLSTSNTITTDNLDISNYTNAVVSVAYAATGVDSGEDLFIEVSYDNGTTWVGTGSAQLVDGTSNAAVNINSLNGLRTPTNANPYTFNISASETQIKLRFSQTGTTGAGEFFWIDDVKVTGLLNNSPTITRTPASLSGFTQTSSTPSSEQTYTVSGNNLTANVSIVPPTGFEISTTTGGSFSATNPIVLTQSGGDLVGEPVTIYVRQSSSTLGSISGNITHTSTGASNVNTGLSGTRTGTYYSKATGNLDDLSNWGLNTDGTGSAPSNFTSDGAIYEIRNRATASIGANWVVSGAASKVVIGDGTNAIDFSIPTGFTLTGTIDVSNAAELTIENTTVPTFGAFATNSSLEYNNVAITLSSAITYRNLKLSGTGIKTFPGGTTTIAGNLILDNCTLADGDPTFSNILLAGNLTYIGSVTPPSDARSITLQTNGAAAGTQTFTGAGNTLRWFRIVTTTANTILLSTSGGSSNIYAGNTNGGGLTLVDGSVLNMNGNDFRLFNNTVGGTPAFIMTTGTISTTSATDLLIERTISGALGPLNFTTGSNTIGNLTLNHAGGTNTLTIGSALNVTGVITVTDGTLSSGGNITLKSNASSTASVAAIGAGGLITGNLTAERYIPAQRKFRFLASPVVGGTATQWRDNGGSTSGIGMQITGSGGATNNFDASSTNAPSAFTYTEANGEATNTTIGGADNAGWSPFSSGTQALTNGQGYRVLVRGDRTLSLVTTPAPAANTTTLSVTGTYPTSPVTINVTRASDVAGKGWNLVGNPYPSAISWNAITKSTEITGTYQTFNPSTNAYVTWNGATGDATDNISSGQGFLVFITSGSSYTSGSITIEEADKVIGNGGSFFKTSLKNHLKISMKYDSNNVNNTFIHFRDQANELFDPAFDAPKLTNPGVNLASKDAKGDYYSINSLPLNALNDTRVVPLSVLNSVEATYTFEFNDVNSFDGQEVYLEDKYTNKTSLLSEGKKYSFTLNSDKASISDGRFNLIFSKKSSGLVNQTKENSFILFPNPASEQIHIGLLNTNNGSYNYEVYNQLGGTIKSGKLDFNSQREQSIGVDEISAGVYFIKVYNPTTSQTIKFIK
jgi:hypothetical protein